MRGRWARALLLPLLILAYGCSTSAAASSSAADGGSDAAIAQTAAGGDAAAQTLQQGPPRRSLLASPCALSACFLMDQSGSMNTAQWAQVRSFAASSASVLASKSKGASVYVAAKFDSNVETVVGKLTKDAKTFGRQVNAAKQNRQGTFTSAGLDRCRALLTGADKRKPRVIIFVTDGRPTLPRKSPDAAALAAAKAAKAAGLTIFSVGVKDSPKASDSTLSPTLLKAVASRGQFFFTVNDFRSLSSAVQSIMPKVCTATVSGKYPADPTPKPAPKPSSKPTPKPSPKPSPKLSPKPSPKVTSPSKSPPPPPLNRPPPPKSSPPPPAAVCPTGSINARFDDLNATITGEVPVPTNYLSTGQESLEWGNWNLWDAQAYAQYDSASGFVRGMVSPNNVAWNNFAQPVTITALNGGTLSLNFFWGTAGWPDASPLTFNVTGYNAADVQVAAATFIANVTQPTLFTLPAGFTGLHKVEWVTQNPAAPSTKQQLVIDNLCLAVAPFGCRQANGSGRTAC